MIPLLAQASTLPLDDSSLANGLKLLALGLAVVALAVTIWDKMRSKPAAHQVYATKDELHRVSDKVDSLVTKIDSMNDKVVESFAKIDRADEARTSNLHRRLDKFGDTLTAVAIELGIRASRPIPSKD